jgi:ABC-type transporter Mla MlaB component
MPLRTNYIPEELRLDLSFSGNLDVSISEDICAICSSPPDRLRVCVVDLTDVERVFDSGVALLQMLYRHFAKREANVVIVGYSPNIKSRMDIEGRRFLHWFSAEDQVPTRIVPTTETAKYDR